MNAFSPPSSSAIPLPIKNSSPLNPSSSGNKRMSQSRPSIHPLSPSFPIAAQGHVGSLMQLDDGFGSGSPMSFGMSMGYMGGAGASVHGPNGSLMRSWKQSFMNGPNGPGFGKYSESPNGMNYSMASPTMMQGMQNGVPTSDSMDPFLTTPYMPASYSFSGMNGSFRSPSALGMPMVLSTSAQGGPRSYRLDGGNWNRAQAGAALKEAEYCKNYVCCGQDLGNMHDLLEHYEEAHVVVIASPTASHMELSMELDPNAAPGVDMDADVDMSTFDEDEPSSSSGASDTAGSSTQTSPVPEHAVPGLLPPSNNAAVSTAMKQLALDDVLKSSATRSGSKTPAEETSSAFDSFVVASPPNTSTFGAGPSSAKASASAAASTAQKPSTQSGLSLSRRAFNGGLSEKSRMQSASAIKSAFGPSVRKESPTDSAMSQVMNFAVAPNVLFGTGAGAPAAPAVSETTASSSASTVAPASSTTTSSVSDPSSSKVGNENAAGNGEPAPSLFSTYRPYRCPQPGCQKSYKQANGLKYHMSKGQCNFEVRDAMEFGGLSQQEAEEKARPFMCAAGEGCTKRYRQMNGLKYHYMNSGLHGEVGLLLLAQGQHPQPPNVPPIAKPRPSSNTIVSARKIDKPFRPNGWVQEAVKASGKELGLPVGQDRRGEDAVLFVTEGGMSL